MPYKVIEDSDGAFCVYKVDAAGEPDGDTLGCHPTRAEAVTQQRALYANEPGVVKAVVKAVEGADDTLIEGIGMPFGGPFNGLDIDGERFTANTDFCPDWFPERPLLYQHGLDGGTKTTVIGRVKSWAIKTDLGVWVQAQLDAQSEYFKAIQDLIKAGRLYFSSGAMHHLVEVNHKSGEIKRWPWVELSLTPTPANLMAKLDFATAEKHYEMAGIKAVWSAAMVNDLDDDCFAYIEDGGELDDEKKTKPRSLRHFPYRTADGDLDEAHVRNALARIPQSDLPDAAKAKALAVIEKAAAELGIGDYAEKAILPESYAQAAETLVAEATELVQRTKDLHERRLKEGRVISAANRDVLAKAMTALADAASVLGDLLKATEPPAKADVAAWQRQVSVLRLYIDTMN